MIVAVIALVVLLLVSATQMDSLSANAKESPLPRIYSPVIPETMTLAGEQVPLDTYYVREGLDRELISNTYGHTSMILYFKRANRYFPIIEPILKRNGIPTDFKYLAVIESGLTNATSPAKAQGFWQFMKTTGQHYGLEVNDEIDMRNNLEASTEAACKYIKSLHDRFGSWTAAAAAYNCGENGLSKNFEKQSIDSYYDTRLNAETSRYVYRLLAIKQIMQHPQQYGFFLRHCDLYPSIPTRDVKLSGTNVNLYDFAKQQGTTYKMLRELNPWITTDKLTNKSNKTYTVKLPTSDGISLSKIRSKKDSSTEYITKI